MRRIIRYFPDALRAFLPDGWKSRQHGGKSWVVRFHHHDGMSGYTPLSMAGRPTLTEDVCGFKTDENEPRTIEMAVKHRQVFERANESRLIKQVLCSAGWFAIYYSTRFVHTLRVSHVLAFPTGLACVAGNDFNAESSSMPGGRIGTAENDFGRRRILRLLGDAALEEHACWVLMYRRRAVKYHEIVKPS